MTEAPALLLVVAVPAPVAPPSRPPCSVPGCGRPNHARGWCYRHYKQGHLRMVPKWRALRRHWRRLENDPAFYAAQRAAARGPSPWPEPRAAWGPTLARDSAVRLPRVHRVSRLHHDGDAA